MNNYNVVMSTEDGMSGGGIEVNADSVEAAIDAAKALQPRFTKVVRVDLVTRITVALPPA